MIAFEGQGFQERLKNIETLNMFEQLYFSTFLDSDLGEPLGNALFNKSFPLRYLYLQLPCRFNARIPTVLEVQMVKTFFF